MPKEVPMRIRTAAAAILLLVAGLGSGVLAAGDHRMTAAGRWAVAYLAEPTRIGDVIVQGPVLFMHDDGAMARGEPCTTVRLFETQSGPSEEVAAFHCIPRRGKAPTRFTTTTEPNARDGFGCVLTSYQFAGDPEVHGVPITRQAH
jgi:hypothetical protein